MSYFLERSVRREHIGLSMPNIPYRAPIASQRLWRRSLVCIPSTLVTGGRNSPAPPLTSTSQRALNPSSAHPCATHFESAIPHRRSTSSRPQRMGTAHAAAETVISRGMDAGAAEAAQHAQHTAQQELAQDAIVWATQHGLVVGAGDSAPHGAVIHAPVAVLPTPFPRSAFQRAYCAAAAFNTLTDHVAADGAYLQSTLAAAAQYDDFTARLLDIYCATDELRRAGRIDQIVLAVNRSDYMLDEPSGGLMQVEMNTIASSFGCLSTIVSQLHRYTTSRAGGATVEGSQLPANDATGGIIDAMAAAYEARGLQGGVMVMLVQPGERNAYDQQWIQSTLWERHGIRTLRRTLADFGPAGSAHVDEATGDLTVDGYPVAIVYLRAGYAPTDYLDDSFWAGRLAIERSNAVKSPSVAYQLAGAKKVQQDLARPGVLERFLDSEADVQLLRSVFAGLWGLDDPSEPETAAVLAAAAAEPEHFVLKPQREGGGNNLYGEELRAKLASGEGLAAYILMQRIQPPINRTLMARAGQAVEMDSLSELGIYGTFVRKDVELLINQAVGHLLRTKAASSDEGGVAAGFAVLDSPLLTEQ